MHTPAPNRTTHHPLALIGGTVILAATLLAAAFAQSAPEPTVRPHSAATPQQVAETLDSIVQPRFQQNAGRFGPDRVVHIEGHGRVEWINPHNHFETRQIAAVKASRRSYVIAFLQCRHKPGAHIDPPTPAEPLQDNFKPSAYTLVATGATQAGAQNTFEWANKALTPVVLPHLKVLKKGHSVQAEYENWVVTMRPVRALHQSCITCHVGAKRGDTLGVMVYAVDKNAKIQGRSFDWSGGGE